MKVKIFIGRMYEVDELFNKWAKGKTLNSQVIIHEHIPHISNNPEEVWMAIVVYHPSTPRWDTSG